MFTAILSVIEKNESNKMSIHNKMNNLLFEQFNQMVACGWSSLLLIDM